MTHPRGWAHLGLVVLLFGGLVSPPAGARPLRTLDLTVDEGRVWRGPTIDRAAGDACGSHNCWTYGLKVPGGGLRLRVAVDHPDHHDRFTIELRDPRGEVAARGAHGMLETREVAVGGPRGGIWTVDVIAEDVEDSDFKMRAILESEPPGPARGKLAPPNLRAEPGFDFSFTAPAGSNYLGSSATPVSISCHPDEVAEDQAIRCLRFSFGYQNAGPGPIDLRFDPLTDLATGTTSVRQRIFIGDDTPTDYSDNDFKEQPAGSATYHKIHGHFHYDAVFQARVFEVTDLKRGETEAFADAEKRGACAHDYVMVDFPRFYQDIAGTADSGSDCSFAFTNPTSTNMRIGLSRGWADIYTAELSDNYVDFLTGEGLFLVRVWADPDDHIRETNERDNVAYSLIRIEGDTVTLLERARGAAPWDPKRVLLSGLGD